MHMIDCCVFIQCSFVSFATKYFIAKYIASIDDFQPPKQRVIRLLERQYFRVSITEIDLNGKDKIVRLAC